MNILPRRNFLRPFRSSCRFMYIMLLLGCCIPEALSQNYKVSGIILDKTDNQPVIGAFVYLNELEDTTQRVAVTTDIQGKFMLSGLKKKTYRLTIQSINYPREVRTLTLSKSLTDLGTIVLAMESKVLNEVVVIGQGTAVQKGDTTVMTADAFKVNIDANAEDLVKKMPGITVENGTIKARGEDVRQVLVDGKPFFGDDPSAALKNLPAEVIDRVQVYNKLSDQAELTGFDDGESSRTINIITKRSNRYSTFGKITGGTDFDEKYLVGGSLNVFSGPRRFTLTGMSNNINQQNFAMQDLIGSSGGGGRSFGGRNFGGWGGISKNSSAGFNYIDNWGKKMSVSGSYFFNTTENLTVTKSNTEYLLIEDGRFAYDTSKTLTKNYNHRFNLRIEYNIDSMNSMIIVPRFSMQNSNSEKESMSLITGGSVNSQTKNLIGSDNSGYNLGNDITWRHKFMKAGRTLSVRSSVSYDKRNSDRTQYAAVDSTPDNQYTDEYTTNLSVNTNFSYTEPLGKNSQLQINYDNRFRRSDNRKELYDLAPEYEEMERLDSLSNLYDNDYITNRAGLAFLYKKNKLNLTAGINYERADLIGTQTFPQYEDISQTFQKFLPNLLMNYKFTEIANLRLFYRTSSYAPSITQLQSVIDNSDRQRLKTGNPDLKQSYTHDMSANFSYANPTTGFNTFVFLSGNYTTDVITNKTIYANGDTLVQPEGIDVTLMPGSQIRYPVNLDYSMGFNAMVNFSYFVKPIKSNVSLVLGGAYTQSPEFAENLLNRQNKYSSTNSLIITSNISSNVDFTLSYTSIYSRAENTVNERNDDESWYQSASAKLNLVLWKGIVFNTDVVMQNNRGLSEGYNEKYMVWNASLGKKFLKSQAAELKIGAYDILDQNKSIFHSVSTTEVTDTKVNAYRRYFLVLFTYNLRANRGKGAPQGGQQQQQPQQQQEQPGRPPYIPGNAPPGGFRPGGGPPGGYHDH